MGLALEEMLLRGFSPDDRNEERDLADVRLEARGRRLNEAVNNLINKWNRVLLIDCQTPEQMQTFRCMVLVLLQMQTQLMTSMKDGK